MYITLHNIIPVGLSKAIVDLGSFEVTKSRFLFILQCLKNTEYLCSPMWILIQVITEGHAKFNSDAAIKSKCLVVLCSICRTHTIIIKQL